VNFGKGTMPGEVLGAILYHGLHLIAAWRCHRGLSHAALARHTGLSEMWLYRTENAGGTSSTATRPNLVVALGTQVLAFAGKNGLICSRRFEYCGLLER
jgi:DNA-binding phage protein